MVFASVMATLGIEILFESGQQLVMRVYKFLKKLGFINKLVAISLSFSNTNFCQQRLKFMQTQPDRDPKKEKWMIGIMVSVTIIKFILMVYCRQFKNDIVRAYALDHLFDVMTNSIGLVAAILAIKFFWWIDPLGAILVSSLAFQVSNSS